MFGHTIELRDIAQGLAVYAERVRGLVAQHEKLETKRPLERVVLEINGAAGTLRAVALLLADEEIPLLN